MNRRGFTFIELILALSITSVIGLSIVTMMAAVSNGITSKDDGRQSAVRLSIAKVRLGAYLAPARCLVQKTPTTLTVWFNDTRESNTIHSSEIRWIKFDDASKQLLVSFVSFPEGWTEEEETTNDVECSLTTDFESLFDTFKLNGWITTLPIVDAIETCTFWINQPEPKDSNQVSMRFSMSSSFGETKELVIDELIRLQQQPMEQQ